MKKHGFKLTNLYNAQVNRKHRLIERENYNVSQKEGPIVPQCPPYKAKAIEKALEWFGIVE